MQVLTDSSRALLLVHTASTLSLVGLIWTIQIVQYPLFERIGAENFVSYHEGHSRLITLVVGPLMLVELLSALSLAITRPTFAPASMAWVGLGLVALIWASTALLQVPMHSILASGFDAQAHQNLVRSNWIRTLAWTARGGLSLWMVSRAV